jgi:Domain of unknown function (DUF1937)
MRKNRPLTYLASPYTPLDPLLSAEEIAGTKQARFKAVAWAAAYLFSVCPSWNIFSPIVHSHPLHAVCQLAGDWKFWARVDKQFIDVSARLVVFCMPGWRQSIGVTDEIKYARKTKVPVFYLNSITFELSKHEPQD